MVSEQPVDFIANRAVEVNEMWRCRQKELELDDKRKGRLSDESGHDSREGDREFSRSRSKRHHSEASCSSSKRIYEDEHFREDEGLRDEEIEKFLQSRAKRGRGSIGSRMDETGPYLPKSSEYQEGLFAVDPNKDEGRHRTIFGPEKPSSWKHCESSDESSDEDRRKRSKKVSSGGSKKKHSRKHTSKEKLKDKRRKKKERRHKH